MINEEILAGNRLLAEFMNCEYDDISETYDIGILKLVEPQAFGDEQFSSLLHDYELDYHCSWDWLIPCIGKISNQYEEPEELDNLKYALLCNDIKTAWNFVVDYIKSKS